MTGRLARFRTRPEDFVVEEQLLYPPSAAGAYTLALVEKREMTTTQAASALARASGVARRNVGFAGRKDRYAVTRQWFSILGVPPSRLEGRRFGDLRVVRAVRHWDRLRLGELLENRFWLRVRELGAEDRSGLEERRQRLLRIGFGNRFGDQRFGRDGDNARQGGAILRGESAVADRRHARFLISSLQSAVFNDLLDLRPALLAESDRDRAHAVVIEGDLVVDVRTGRLSEVAEPDAVAEAVAHGELSPTGLLFGTRASIAGGAVGELEREVLRRWRVPEPSDWPLRIDVRGERRPLRALPHRLEIDPVDEDLVVEMALGPGVFATVALAELFPGIEEGPMPAAPVG